MSDGDRNDKDEVAEGSSSSAKHTSVSEEVDSEIKESSSINASGSGEVDSKSMSVSPSSGLVLHHAGGSPGDLKLDDLVYEDLDPTEDEDETTVKAIRMAVLDAMLSDEEDDDVEVQIN